MNEMRPGRTLPLHITQLDLCALAMHLHSAHDSAEIVQVSQILTQCLTFRIEMGRLAP